MIKIVGLGPGAPEALTYGAIKALEDSDNLFFRTEKHPTVDYLKENNDVQSQDEVNQQIEAMGSGAGDAPGKSGGENERDMYFADAGRFIIDKDKASIGMLQRVFKIGFNRAARIMDQLCEYGVVGEEEGTKPRKVLMTEEQFEQLLEEI